MKLILKKQIGKNNYHFEVEGANLGEVIKESKKLSFHDVTNCGICGSTNLILDFHTAKQKFTYFHITCQECRGSLNFGQKMENPDIFYLKKEWQEYKFVKHQEEVTEENPF